jgi:hypothetical protein
MKPFARILGCGAFLALTCASLLAQDSSRTGIIGGVVLDATDQPVADARVRANFNGAWDGIVPNAFTDKSGHFVIRGLGWGEWYVTPSKEQDGYPDESNAFYAGPSFAPVIVALDAEHPEQTVTVHLGRKAGTIFGTIADADSGEPVEPWCSTTVDECAVYFVVWLRTIEIQAPFARSGRYRDHSGGLGMGLWARNSRSFSISLAAGR